MRGSVRLRCDYATALDFEVDPFCVCLYYCSTNLVLLCLQFDPVYLLLCVFITAVPVLRFKTQKLHEKDF